MLKASDGDLTSQSDSLPSSVSVHVSVKEGGCAAWHYAFCPESALSSQCLQTIHQTAVLSEEDSCVTHSPDWPSHTFTQGSGDKLRLLSWPFLCALRDR